jgi:hypothetical protein
MRPSNPIFQEIVGNLPIVTRVTFLASDTIWTGFRIFIDISLTTRLFLDKVSKNRASLLKGFVLREVIPTKKTKQEIT